MELIMDMALLSLLGVIALAVVRLRRLFAAVMLMSAFSFIAALLLASLDAVDVAFTEAAVGAGISTLLMLAALALTPRREKAAAHAPLLPLAVAVITGAALIYGMSDAPPFASPAAPVHHHVAPFYLENTKAQIGIPNVVTAILASYRGFDTLGEVVVIFTAGLGVMLLLQGGRRRTDSGPDVAEAAPHEERDTA